MAQILTFKEAKEIAHQLFRIELLSKKGEKKLLQELEKSRIENKSDSIEKSFIIKFLYHAFYLESYYREGTLTQRQYREYQKMIANLPQQETLSVEEEKILAERFKEEFGISKVKEIEEAIKNEEEDTKTKEDSSRGWVVYPPIYLKEENTNIIHKTRSTFGKTTTRTINDLFEIGLINEVIFDDLSEKIREENVRGEDLVIILILERI